MTARSQPLLIVSLLLTMASLAMPQAATEPRPFDAANSTAATSPPTIDSAATLVAEADIDSDKPASPEAADRIARADKHFSTGQQFYRQGDVAGARREFDAAVDVLLRAPDSLPDRDRIERRLQEICDLIYQFDVENLGAGESEEAMSFDKAPIDEISHMTFPVDPALAPKLRTELNQTSSAIPLDLSDPVLSYVHYFSTDRGRNILLAGLRRSGRYKALIERIFAEEGVPQELIYLAQAESGFLPRAISNKHAVGMWQFIAGTGADYALVHTSVYDERFDPEKATRAAAKLLKDLYARYGDWYLAMAAYNCGPGAVDRAIERTGYADYWELLKRHALPTQTANYVPIIIAMTIMAKNPQDYGLTNVDVDPPVDYDSVQLTAPTGLNLIADATMQPVSDVRELNPSLLSGVAPTGFDIHVPKGAGEAVRAALESVPAENRQAWRLHHVQAGDTIPAIARSYHVAPDRILAVNHTSDSLQPGGMLLIPAVYHPDTPPRSRLRHSHSKAGIATASRARVSRATRRGSHVVGSRSISTQTPRRKLVVRAAAVQPAE